MTYFQGHHSCECTMPATLYKQPSCPHSLPSHTQVQSPPLVFFKILLLVLPKVNSRQEALLQAPSLPGPQWPAQGLQSSPDYLLERLHIATPYDSAPSSLLLMAFCFSGTACPCCLCSATIPPSEDLKPSCQLLPATWMCLWKLSLWSQGSLQRTQAQLTGGWEHPKPALLPKSLLLVLSLKQFKSVS